MAYRETDGAVIDRPRNEHWPALEAAPSIVPIQTPGLDSDSPVRPRSGTSSRRCPEIDCIRHLFPPIVLDLAEFRAAEADVGADRVLIALGILSEETYVAALAAWLGLAFDPLFNTPRERCPLPDDRLPETANTGMLPLIDRNGISFVVVPRLVDSRRLVALATADKVRSIRITSTARLRAFITRHSAQNIEYLAADELRDWHPEMSAGVSPARRLTIWAYAALVAITAIAVPGVAMTIVETLLGAVFLAWTGLRLLGLVSERFVRRRPQEFLDDGLPSYSIIVALYREAAAAPGLVAALQALDYPPEKLDIKLVVEPDDEETWKALHALQLGPTFEIIVAPGRGPRTKPKALNAALPFARGTFVAVFDAEDRPEPNQLRLALEAFVAGNARLACVQARLTIDNTTDSWLTRVFTAEYAGLFDVFLPGLATWRLPLPLGGSSNHFRGIR